VGSHRLPGPVWARLAGGLVADGEHEVEQGRIRLGELIPILAAQPFGRNMVALKQFQGERVYCPLGVAAGTESLELAAADAQVVHDGLGQDRAGGVSRTQEQHVEDFLFQVLHDQ